MPYIPAADRAELDECVELLARLVGTEASQRHAGLRVMRPYLTIAGRLNYVLTRLVMRALPVGTYASLALATGVLENVKQEMYRRSGAPYEDTACRRNGDIPEYEGR